MAYAFAHGLFVAPEWLFARDGDVGRHVRVGTWILQHGRIPFEDHFSHTLGGARFVPYEWLSEVSYALAHAAAGLAGVALLAATLFAATCAAVFRITRRLGVGPLLAFATVVVSLVLQNRHLLPRPHLFTTLLAVISFTLLWEYRRGGHGLLPWLVPPLVAVWANLHGGFLVAYLLLGVFLLDAVYRRWRIDATPGTGNGSEGRRELRTLGAVAVVSLLASLLNPVGWEVLSHTTGYLRSDYLVDQTQEYQSPDFHRAGGLVFLGVLLFGFVLAVAGLARPAFLEVLLLLLWSAASLYSARNIPIFGVVAVPILGAWTSRTLGSLARDPSLKLSTRLAALAERQRRIGRTDAALARPAALWLVLGLLAAVALGPGRDRYRFSPEVFPVQALPAARAAGVSGPVFNQFRWGGYLLYEAWPEVPVFIDGQTDFYGERLTREYARVIELEPGWNEVLDRYGVTWTLTSTGASLNQGLALSPEWRLVHRDGTATVFLRRP